jgi:hypothetical protein
MDVSQKAGVLAVLVTAATPGALFGPKFFPASRLPAATTSGLQVPVFPDSVPERRQPAEGEARYLSFRSQADPEQIRRYFTEDGNLAGWRFTGRLAGSAGMILQDNKGRRLIIDIKSMSCCLLMCQQHIHNWQAEK